MGLFILCNATLQLYLLIEFLFWLDFLIAYKIWNLHKMQNLELVQDMHISQFRFTIAKSSYYHLLI